MGSPAHFLTTPVNEFHRFRPTSLSLKKPRTGAFLPKSIAGARSSPTLLSVATVLTYRRTPRKSLILLLINKGSTRKSGHAFPAMREFSRGIIEMALFGAVITDHGIKAMELKRFIRRKFQRLVFQPDYVRTERLLSFNAETGELSSSGS